MDYDEDNDGYIEIDSLAQLNAVRHDIDGNGDPTSDGATTYAAAFPGADDGMGCPDNHCAGYELTRSLDFEDASSYASGAVNAAWTQGNGWLPIGIGDEASFSAIFDGNDHTIANLYINRFDLDFVGLFSESYGDIRRTSIRRIGMVDVNVLGVDFVGGLVGMNHNRIASSYVTGSVSGDEVVGGLVGRHPYVDKSTIHASYATGKVSSRTNVGVGGFIGANEGAAITAGYWDVETSGQSIGVGYGVADEGIEGKTTSELQSPTGYASIYADWNIDFDNADNDFDDATGRNDFWDFGSSNQYPALKVDFNGNGIATSQEFGNQPRLALTPTPTPVPTSTQPPGGNCYNHAHAASNRYAHSHAAAHSHSHPYGNTYAANFDAHFNRSNRRAYVGCASLNTTHVGRRVQFHGRDVCGRDGGQPVAACSAAGHNRRRQVAQKTASIYETLKGLRQLRACQAIVDLKSPHTLCAAAPLRRGLPQGRNATPYPFSNPRINAIAAAPSTSAATSTLPPRA